MGNVVSWQHRRFAGDIAEMDPILLNVPGNRYAVPIRVITDPNFASVAVELSGFPTAFYSYEDFLA